ncbi:type IV pilus secretin PilQ family protein [Lysobacter sp. GX 14042]|uniref:type IV pilus secretin PilQ n=1 Tax=Lysobacter sp. GX 14042 TaxID=2907155 RepID=UPI001F40A9DE|nr:type IV pilus secretin PilQ family protein [Lysobacter sp. GX 14042]MCE7033466.1 type IV pilus secretin PilQ family protein [Lysobacter sp. GX 14042]
MTVFNNNRSQRAQHSPQWRRAGRGIGLGLLAGALAAFTAVHAAPLGQSDQAATTAVQPAPLGSPDPAKQLPGAISVSDIDFKRGQGGAARLTVRFSGEGAIPDLRNEGSRVVVKVPNAQLPAHLQRPLDVSDFATPVGSVEARASGAGATLVLNTGGAYESLAYQTGNEYIVEVVPRVDVAASQPARGERAMGATESIDSAISDRSYSGLPVTFNFQDVPVRTALQLIAEMAGLNLVAADNVQGNLTLRLVNVPWDQALDLILQAKGLDKRRNGNVIWIAPQGEIASYEQAIADARSALENKVELVTEYIQINYHNAEQIYTALTEARGVGGGQGGSQGQGGNTDTGFMSQRGRLVADARTNTLMVSDTPKKVAEMKELIRVIDRPVDQVVIEARVVIATESVARELGARFGVSGTTSGGDIGFSGNLKTNQDNMNSVNDGDPTTNTITRGLMTDLAATNPAGALALSILNAGYLLDVELSAMQQQGRGEVISNPRVVTSNQREAVIRQGEEVGYVTIQPATAGGVATPSVQFKDVLLEMVVTPTITNDGRVFLNLNVKKDEVEGWVDTSIGDVPRIAKREVNTAVLIEDGQTVVIGGVYEFRDRDDVRKVPFLGDIPFLGNLFKNKSRSNEKAELLIFVTPRVLEVAQRNHRG